MKLAVYRGCVSVGGDHFVAEACTDSPGPAPRCVAAGDRGEWAAGGDPQRTMPGQVPRARESRPGFDAPGFRDYVTARSRSLLRTAYLLTGNRADAEDLVQAALAKTYLAWDRIEGRGALDGYVRRAMVNTHISWWRRRRLEEYPTDELPDQAVADHSGTSDLQDTLRRARHRRRPRGR